MNLQFSNEYEAFRQEVKAFLAENDHVGGGVVGAPQRAIAVAFRRKAIERGYLARGVPRRYGGSEQPDDLLRSVIIGEELERAGAPQDPAAPVAQLIPTLLEHGSEFQKETYLPPTVTGELHWCQGYSEPGSGSDLASVSTRAELVGDEWVINGQKIWTTGAQHAEMMYLLVRTEPAAGKHAGISYLLLDMRAVGIEVSPLLTMIGSEEFSQVFFNDVRTPANHLVGRRGAGWTVSRSTLKHERGLSTLSSHAAGRQEFEAIIAFARETLLHGRPAIEDAGIRQKLVEIDACLIAQETADWIQLSSAANNRSPGPISLMMKLASTDIGHRVAKLTLDLMGDETLHAPPPDAQHINSPGMALYMGSLAYAVAAGTSNIQRNLIGEHGYGLPRDAALRKGQ